MLAEQHAPDPLVYSVTLDNLCDVQVQRIAGAPPAASTASATREKDEEVLSPCRAAVRADPTNPIAHYNLAGAYALLLRHDEAFQALEKDLELGDTDHEYLEQDPWFEALRGDPRFAELLGRMKMVSGSGD